MNRIETQDRRDVSRYVASGKTAIFTADQRLDALAFAAARRSYMYEIYIQVTFSRSEFYGYAIPK